jgi:hypothetical protein
VSKSSWIDEHDENRIRYSTGRLEAKLKLEMKKAGIEPMIYKQRTKSLQIG